MNNPILLDTCTMIWMGQDAKLSEDADSAINGADVPVSVSAISAWELGMLASKGRFTSPLLPQVWFDRFMEGAGFRVAPLPPDVLIASSFLPGAPPKDPIDRIIVATARSENLTLITRDRAILTYAEAGHLNAIRC